LERDKPISDERRANKPTHGAMRERVVELSAPGGWGFRKNLPKTPILTMIRIITGELQIADLRLQI
jgi:hypothetical protein